MLSVLAEGFLLGLSLGVTCLGTCLPVLIPYLLKEKRGILRNIGGVILFLAGRFVGYIAFGALAGGLGGQIPGRLRQILTGCAYILLAGLLIYQALRRESIEKTCPVKRWQRLTAHPALFGLLLGLNPCPPFLLAVNRAIEAGGVLIGAVLFAGFFAGTSVYFLPFGLVGTLARFKAFRWIAKGIALLVGLWFAITGIISLVDICRTPKQLKFEVVDPMVEDTIFIAGDSIAIEHFITLVDTAMSADFIMVDLDSVPERSLLVTFDEMPDTSRLLQHEVGVVFANNDSVSVENTARILRTYGFKRRPGNGFFFEVGGQ
ncbi:hypothetical protein DRQ36_11375 [bacterium]|nr:MAG: hypothetical protein DRQ36_11375 [bacterium]